MVYRYDRLTYGYHIPPVEPETVTLDGIEYRRIWRLPRNVREGDVIRLGDNTSRDGYLIAYVTVTDVQSWPQEIRGYRRYAPHACVWFRLRPADDSWRWRSWGGKIEYRDSETHEPISIYRKAVKRGAR